MDFLDRIIETKRQEIQAARQQVSEAELRRRAKSRKPSRPFRTRLAAPGPSGVNIIAEIKRASPSKGALNENLDPARYALSYERAGAAALSVLTDPSYFKGSLSDLAAARRSVSLPVLRKEFIISEYQICESASHEADAVLLIARILSTAQIREYLALCRELGLDAIVEVHSEEDLSSASLAGADLIGINNRDLQTFETRIETSIRLAPLLSSGQVAVAASGIRNVDDLRVLKAAGIFNFLIGESLVRAGSAELFLKTLLDDSHAAC